MKKVILTTLCLLCFGVALADAVPVITIQYFQGFENDYVAGRNVPDLVDPALSTGFSEINESWSASGLLTLRDRDIGGGGLGGGAPIGNVRLDFTAGEGSYVTFRFPVGMGTVLPGSSVSFDVVAYGGDSGSLFKYVSSNGTDFVQVGDASDAYGTYTFPLAAGGTETFFRLQVGTAAGVWEGVHVDNFSAVIPEPTTLSLLTLGGLALIRRRKESAN